MFIDTSARKSDEEKRKHYINNDMAGKLSGVQQICGSTALSFLVRMTRLFPVSL